MPLRERRWAPESIPDSVLFPEGAFEFEIEDIDESATGENAQTPGAAMIVVRQRCVGPTMAGMVHTDRFVLGTAEDPEGLDPKTLERTGVPLKRLLKKAGVELTSDLADDCARAIGQHILLVLGRRKQGDKNRDGSDNPFAGREENNVTGTYALGEVELGPPHNGPSAAPVPRAAAPRPAARPTAPAPRPAPARPAAAPARPAPQPARPAPAPAPAAARQVAPKREPMLKCSLCDDTAPHVAKSNFPAHVALHEQGLIDLDTGAQTEPPEE